MTGFPLNAMQKSKLRKRTTVVGHIFRDNRRTVLSKSQLKARNKEKRGSRTERRKEDLGVRMNQMSFIFSRCNSQTTDAETTSEV